MLLNNYQQIKELSKNIKYQPKLDMVSILKEVNDNTMMERGLTKKEIDEFDREIEQKINDINIFQN